MLTGTEISTRSAKTKIYCTENNKFMLLADFRKQLSDLQTSMFHLFRQLHTVVEGGHQIVAQAGADVAMMKTFLH